LKAAKIVERGNEGGIRYDVLGITILPAGSYQDTTQFDLPVANFRQMPKLQSGLKMELRLEF
jgi:hypothetical protein